MNTDPNKMFAETPLVRRKLRQEAFAKWLFCFMAAAMVVPLLLIIGYLLVRAAHAMNHCRPVRSQICWQWVLFPTPCTPAMKTMPTLSFPT